MNLSRLSVISKIKRIIRKHSVIGVLAILVIISVPFIFKLNNLVNYKKKNYLNTKKQNSLTKPHDENDTPSPNSSYDNEYKVKILCYILIQKENIRKAKVIQETWGSHCDKLVFYGNFVTTIAQVVSINVTEGYEFLWGKTKAALTHAYHQYGQEYNWFLKADDDTFVIMDNLRHFILNIERNNSSHGRKLWFGFKMWHKKMTHGYHSGGAGYVMNSKALAAFVSLLRTNEYKDYINYDPKLPEEPLKGCKTLQNQGIEDLELGRCFHALGVSDVATIDNHGRERFLPLSLTTLMSGDLPASHWLWKQSWNRFRPGKHCCSTDLIAIHEVSPSQLRILYFLVYQLQPRLTYKIPDRIIGAKELRNQAI